VALRCSDGVARRSPFVAELGPRARRDLLRVLTSSSEVRADVIRQLTERGSALAELLIELEAEDREWARLALVEALQERH
jgi:hypothetical protein